MQEQKPNKKQQKYHKGQNLDVQDSVNKWVNAQVLYADEKQIYVHYSGYSAKFDQYIPNDSSRILEQWQPGKQIKLCNRVDGYHPIGGWLQARVIQKDKGSENRLKIHFFNYDKKYDRWVDIKDKNQITIIGSRTKAYGIGKKRAKNAKKLISQAALKAIREKLEKFMQTLKQNHWIMKGIQGDGNCLFRSVSHQLYGEETFHAQIRQVSMKYLQLQRNFFQDYIIEDIESYIGRKRKLGQWGDDIQIQAISEIYGRPIQIYAFGDKPIRTFHQDNVDQIEPLRLAYVGHCHYNSIFKANQIIQKNSQKNQTFRGIMNSQFGKFESHFFQTFDQNRDKIIKNRAQFSYSNTVEQFIDEHFEAQNRVDDQHIQEQSELAKALQISEKQQIINQIQKAEIKQIENRTEMERLQQDLRKLQEKQIAQVLKISESQSNRSSKPPKPYWFNDLLSQGYSQQEIEYAIQINGYDPDSVQNFLLDNVLL